MKKRLVTLLCTMLSVSILSTSCIGSFPLFHKIHSWNEGVSDNKFVNELVFVCFHIIPVYEVCYLADGLIFNSIEFCYLLITSFLKCFISFSLTQRILISKLVFPSPQIVDFLNYTPYY